MSALSFLKRRCRFESGNDCQSSTNTLHAGGNKSFDSFSVFYHIPLATSDHSARQHRRFCISVMYYIAHQFRGLWSRSSSLEGLARLPLNSGAGLVRIAVTEAENIP